MRNLELLKIRDNNRSSSPSSLRHPEKAKNPDHISPPKPSWIRVKAPNSQNYAEIKKMMRAKGLHTVCEEAACPNIGECWEKKHATFMIMGSICTRACAFCNIQTGKPKGLDLDEPQKIADSVVAMGLSHVVITSVDRDDLKDGGAQHFIDVIHAIRKRSPRTTIEILTPDFKRQLTPIERVAIEGAPDVFNHNLETVPRLYSSIRPGARYFSSIHLLQRAKEVNPDLFTKSGLMVGLGESKEEIIQVMDDLRAANVDFLTIGQYLQPTPKHAKLERYVTPDEFEHYAKIARGKGFLQVAASPLTRSSYHAEEDFQKLKKLRKK